MYHSLLAFDILLLLNKGTLVGIDIDNATEKINLKELILN